MTRIRGYLCGGHPAFLTHVTYNRRPLLVENADLLRRAWRGIRRKSRVRTLAWVVMPDHMHMIVDAGERELSSLVRRFKLSFSTSLRARLRLKTGRVWQYRYWDHIIRDQDDLHRHLDYTHHNPVKHGLAQAPREWRLSSFRQYVLRGYYDVEWRAKDTDNDKTVFGE